MRVKCLLPFEARMFDRFHLLCCSTVVLCVRVNCDHVMNIPIYNFPTVGILIKNNTH